MKDIVPSMSAPQVSRAELRTQVHLAHVAMMDAERAEQAAKATASTKTDEADRCRLVLGQKLKRARSEWPQRGPNSKGWGELLRDLGITTDRALDLMKLAGYVEQVSGKSDSIPETIPTYADAGITKRPAQVEPATQNEIDTTRARAAVTDEQREAAYRREASNALPAPIETREAATHSLVGFVSEARAQLRRITEKNIHLTDVTTSPEDFMRAKQMFIDIVNLCLDELASAGVLDGKEQRRQMQLLKGGLQ